MLGLIFAAVLVGACLVALDRKDTRSTRALEAERATHRAEIQTLLQRIQAPEQAVVEHLQANVPDEPAYPLNDEETAEAQDEKARWIAEVERMEAQGILS